MVARELDGERGAPRAGAEDRDGDARVAPRAHDRNTAMPSTARGYSQLVTVGCVWLAAYSASKLTGGSRNCGKPPWLTSCETAARAYGNNTPGHTVLIARFRSASFRLRMTNRPACLTSTRKMVASPSLADTVTVSTTSRTSGPSAAELVWRSRLICGFQLLSTRGPLGDSYEQSFR